jgi:hypothetical protein
MVEMVEVGEEGALVLLWVRLGLPGDREKKGEVGWWDVVVGDDGGM